MTKAGDWKVSDLLQSSFEARVSVRLHTWNIERLERKLKTVDALAVCAPILFLGGQYLPEPLRTQVGAVGALFSVGLLGGVVLSLVLEWRPKLKLHQDLLVRNLVLAERLKRAAARAQPPSAEEQVLLDAEVTDVQGRDLSLLKSYKNDRAEAYRETLKESGAAVRCPVCSSNPWKLKRDKTRECCGNGQAAFAG